MNRADLLHLQRTANPATAAAIAAELAREARPSLAQCTSEEPKPSGPAMNQWERQWAAELEALRAAGEVRWYAFEPVRLRLAGHGRVAWYTPDFGVAWADGRTEFHEVKGFWREAARVRIKVAAGMYPWPFVAIRKVDGRWVKELI
jgi:hypothetical protein